MDFRAAVFLMCMLVSASFITQSKAIFGPAPPPDGKRYSKFSPEADEGNFNQVQCLMFVTLRNVSSIQASSSLSNAVDVITFFLLFCFFVFILQNSLDEGRTIRDLCVAMRDVCEGGKRK